MKKFLLLSFLILSIISCEKEESFQNIQMEELYGYWKMSSVEIATIKADDRATQEIKEYLKDYQCDGDWYEFFSTTLYINRRNCMSGGFGRNYYKIERGNIVVDEKYNNIEATDLRLIADTLYLNRDETRYFNRVFTGEVTQVVLRKKYIRVNN